MRSRFVVRRRTIVVTAAFVIGVIGGAVATARGNQPFCPHGASVEFSLGVGRSFSGSAAEFVEQHVIRQIHGDDADFSMPAFDVGTRLEEVPDDGRQYVDVIVGSTRAGYFLVEEDSYGMKVTDQAVCHLPDGSPASPALAALERGMWAKGENEPGDGVGTVTDEALRPEIADDAEEDTDQ